MNIITPSQKVAQRLGDPRATTQNLRQIIDKHIVSPSEREKFLEGVQFKADELVRTLAQAQRDITGQTTIGEANTVVLAINNQS